MASASIVRIDQNVPTAFNVPNLASSSASKASSVLQTNHQVNDVIFNSAGLHNHIVHHILAAYALGADSSTLQKHYDNNAQYQRPPRRLDLSEIERYNEADNLISQLQKPNPENYNNLLAFFTRQLDAASVADVLNTYLFNDTQIARTIFNRMFAGYLHPLIHLGYGIEFSQPAIVAEAVAQACIHPSYMDPFFDSSADAANSAKPDSLVNLQDKIHADEKVSTAAHWGDDHKVRDGLLKRAKDEMITYASQWQVQPHDVERATAEMIAACAYFAGGAQHPPKTVKFDFYYMHAVNSSIFFTSFSKQDWVSNKYKAKLLEWKGRLDLALYASRRSPTLLVDEIKSYPSCGELYSWEIMFERARVYEDDGHTAKFVRALAHGQKVCGPYENDHELRMKGDMWQRMAMMVIDSVQPEKGDRWVRHAGFEQAWEHYPDRLR